MDDVEFDMPALDELEWLESEALMPEVEETEDHEGFVIPENPGIPFHKSTGSTALADDPGSNAGVGGSNISPSASDDPASKKRYRREDKGDTGGPDDRVIGITRRHKRSAFQEKQDAREPHVTTEKFISRSSLDIEGNCIPVTSPNGDRVYAKLDPLKKDGVCRSLVRESPIGQSLLTEPISDLIDKVEQEQLSKILENTFGSPSSESQPKPQAVIEELWVEKYAPKSFMELLSDEQTNREVLLWLKQWDSSVFGSQNKSTTDEVLSALRRHSYIKKQQHHIVTHNHHGSKDFPYKRQGSMVREKETPSAAFEMRKRKPSNQLPDQKVLLLCGPPGLGKTTLSHVVARHCGYRVVEINASDDRSASTIESKILDVVQMNSVTADSRPRCLVIDEIDGALGEGKGAVEVILKMVTTEKIVQARHGDQEPEARKSTRKASRIAALSRPVICICNDLYAPALRPLRQVAKVHIFTRPTVHRVVNRLKFVCEREGFRTSSVALSALVEYTECDIRSCLNTLQFLNKRKESLSILDFSSQVVGQKDISRSAFDVWKQVFQKKKVKCKSQLMKDCNGYQNFEFLYSLISNRGEYELTVDGIHENLLQLSYHDPLMKKTIKCLNAFGLSDLVLRYIMRTQKMSLQAYQPVIVINMSNLISQVEKPNIVWPKSFQSYRSMANERKDMLKSWQNKISPYISRHLLIESFAEDTVSPFLRILAPPNLRPVAVNLLSEKERNDLEQLVDTMVSYCVTYKISKSESQVNLKYGKTSDAATVINLDPPINDFVNFKDFKLDCVELSSTMKQVLVNEVEKQKIMRETNRENDKSQILRSQTTHSEQESPSIKMGRQCNGAPSSLPDMHRNLSTDCENTQAEKNPKKVSMNATNFFDRFRIKNDKDARSDANELRNKLTNGREPHLLLFKYKEGFTNAVKIPVKMRDLLRSEGP